MLSRNGNHQANGAAKAAVKTVNELFYRTRATEEDPYLGLLSLCKAPTKESNCRPAQKIFGRRTLGPLPNIRNKLSPLEGSKHKQMKHDYTVSKKININKNRQGLAPVQTGPNVCMQPIDNFKEWKEGMVTSKLSSRRQD